MEKQAAFSLLFYILDICYVKNRYYVAVAQKFNRLKTLKSLLKFSVSYDNKVLLIGGETEGGKALTSVQTMSYDGKQLKVE